MGKIIRRMMLDDLFAIGRNETWFADMSKKGLHLRKFGRVFVHFEKGEPEEIRYRMEVLKEKPSSEQLEIYAEFGWKLVTSNGCFYVFSADEGACVRELHTDPIEQGYTLTDLNQLLKRNTVIMSVAMIILVGMISGMYLLMDEPILLMVEGSFIQQMLLIAVELYVFSRVIRNYQAIRDMKKSLLQGAPIEHKVDYKRARMISGIMTVMINLIAIFSLTIPFTMMARNEEYTLPEEVNALPLVRLAEIENSPELVRETRYLDRGVDWKNRVRSDWSLLTPIQYEIDEHGEVPSEMWADGSGEYSPSIRTQFYRLSYDGLSEALTKDLINRYVWEDEVEILEISYPGIDKVFVAEDHIQKQIFAYQGERVMHVTYYGKADISEIVPLVMEELISFEG